MVIFVGLVLAIGVIAIAWMRDSSRHRHRRRGMP